MGLERLLQVASLVIISGLMLENIGPENYASWQYAYTLVTIFTTLTWFCGAELLTPILFELNDEERDKYISTFLWIKIIFCATLSIIAIAVGLNLDNRIASSFVICSSVLFLLREPLMTGYSILQFERRVDLLSKISIVMLFVKLALIFLILKSNFYEDYLALPWVFEGVLLSGLVFYFSKIKISKMKFLIDRGKIRNLLIDGMVVWLTIVLSILYFKIDKILLKDVADPRDYVAYAASSQLNENFLSLATMAIQIIAPYYIYVSKGDRSINHRLMVSMVIYGLALLILAGLVSVLSFDIGLLIFKQGQLLIYLPKLIFLLPLFGIDGLINSYLFKLRSVRLMIIKSSLMFFMMISANIIGTIFFDRVIAQMVALYVGIFFSIIFGLAVSFNGRINNKLEI